MNDRVSSRCVRNELRPIDELPAGEPYCLDVLHDVIKADLRQLDADEVRWLLAEAFRLRRANRALDARVAEAEREVKAKDGDYAGVCLEYADLSDENARLKQESEINKIVLDARARMILELQKRLESAAASWRQDG